MKSLRDTIYKREQTPINFDEIMIGLKPHADPAFKMLDDLPHNPTDDQIFGSKDCCLILCTVHAGAHNRVTTINHWVSLIKRKSTGNKLNFYEFFDSLGNSIKKITLRVHDGKQSLVNWAKDKRVVENSVQLQKYSEHVNSCGLHQIVRLSHLSLNNTQYTRWLKVGFLEPDVSVSMLCYLDLLKS